MVYSQCLTGGCDGIKHKFVCVHRGRSGMGSERANFLDSNMSHRKEISAFYERGFADGLESITLFEYQVSKKGDGLPAKVGGSEFESARCLVNNSL